MNFTLRPWKLSDLDSLVKYANNPKIAANLTNGFPNPYHRENGEAFINMAMEHDPIQIFAIDIKGEACGGIGLHPQTDIHEKNVELGYWLAEPFWGKGIVTAAVKQIVIYGFKTFDIERIFARPFGYNIASQKLLEKAGFTFECRFEKTIFKNGVYQDELFYAIRRENANL
jgi:RimJ/RimL family protein N-acetyltransferase